MHQVQDAIRNTAHRTTRKSAHLLSGPPALFVGIPAGIYHAREKERRAKKQEMVNSEILRQAALREAGDALKGPRSPTRGPRDADPKQRDFQSAADESDFDSPEITVECSLCQVTQRVTRDEQVIDCANCGERIRVSK